MRKIFIEKYGLLVYPDNHGVLLKKCTTYIFEDVDVVEFETEDQANKYIETNNITTE